MKKTLIGLVSAAALSLALQAHAISYNLTFTGGGSAAVGTIDVAGGLATSGYLTITAGSHLGTYALTPGTGVATVSALGWFSTDGLVFVGSDPFLNGNGLLFSDGITEVNLWGNGPGDYSLYTAPPGYDPAVNGGTATLTAVPDGGMTAALLGMGMLGLGYVRRMVK